MGTMEAKWSPATPPVRVEYGPRTVDEVGGGQVSSSGLYKENLYEFNWDGLPAYNAGTGLEAIFPAGSVVQEVLVQSVTGWVGDAVIILSDGTTDVALGTAVAAAESDGGWSATPLPALPTSSGTTTKELEITGPTAGRLKVIVRYVDSQNRQGK